MDLKKVKQIKTKRNLRSLIISWTFAQCKFKEYGEVINTDTEAYHILDQCEKLKKDLGPLLEHGE